MTETLDPMAATEVDQKQLAEQLLAQAKEQGVELMGPNGLLNQLTKNVLETALDAEMTEHLGYEKHEATGRGSGNSRNGTRSKTVFTEIGPVEIEVPRDIDSSFTPQIVKKRQRRLTGIDEIVLSLTAKGLTTGEVSAHFECPISRSGTFSSAREISASPPPISRSRSRESRTSLRLRPGRTCSDAPHPLTTARIGGCLPAPTRSCAIRSRNLLLFPRLRPRRAGARL